MLSSRRHCGSLPGHYLDNRGPSKPQQPQCASQRLLSPHPYMVPISPWSFFTRHPELLGTQGSASCSSCARPHSVPHNAFQGAQRIENKDNMYYTGRHRPGRTETAPSGGASRKAGHPFTHSSLVGTGPAFFRASAQRGPGTPAGPARGCTSRSPDWPLPHSHS